MTKTERLVFDDRWRAVYDLLADLNEGDVVPYSRLESSVRLGPEKRYLLRSAIRRASLELLADMDRSFEVVPQEGVRRLPQTEHDQHKNGDPLNAKEQALWLALVEYWLVNCSSPSHADLMRTLGTRSESETNRAIDGLVAKGYAHRVSGVARSLRPTQWPDERRPAW